MRGSRIQAAARAERRPFFLGILVRPGPPQQTYCCVTRLLVLQLLSDPFRLLPADCFLYRVCCRTRDVDVALEENDPRSKAARVAAARMVSWNILYRGHCWRDDVLGENSDAN